ncbi:MAG: hypothetical protein K6F57_00370 [Candidatus Saccharibacteria bacterium]|nr:hypothetical protein [Candidatus Saccharibacteria bacterium]
MIRELIIEAITLLVMAIMAHVIGWKRVKLIDRPEPVNFDDYIIKPPLRKPERARIARELAKKFVKRNADESRIETESLIVLPSIGFNWTIGVIAGAIIACMLLTNHIYGVAEFLRNEHDHSIFYDFFFGAGGLALMGVLVAMWFALVIMPNAEKRAAMKIANRRAMKWRTVRFAQNLSIDEVLMYAKWAVREEFEEKMQAWTSRRRNRE